MSEDTVEDEVCRYAEDAGMLAISVAGDIDRVIVTKEGLVAFVTFKEGSWMLAEFLSPSGKKTAREIGQHGMLAELTGRKCETFVVGNVEQGKRMIDLISDAARYQAIRYGEDEATLTLTGVEH